MIVPTKKHGNATAKDIESGFLLLDHPQASLSKSGFPAVSEADLPWLWRVCGGVCGGHYGGKQWPERFEKREKERKRICEDERSWGNGEWRNDVFIEKAYGPEVYAVATRIQFNAFFLLLKIVLRLWCQLVDKKDYSLIDVITLPFGFFIKAIFSPLFLFSKYLYILLTTIIPY